jgi:hypothetical protein
MQYCKCRWIHENDDEPVLIYIEMNADRLEVRKVEEYADGRLDYADKDHETGSTGHGFEPIPSFEKINADPEFDLVEITKDEFDVIWQRALDAHAAG